MKITLAILATLIGASALAEQCDIFSVSSNQETLVEHKVLQGRSNTGVIPGGFKYSITSMPGEVDFVYLSSATQIVKASGLATSAATPLYVSNTDFNGNGAAVRCGVK